jgi:uncharacterized membrane protein
LLRNPKYCIYGATSQKTCSSTSSLETAFNSASVKERSKFEQETLVNVGGSSTRRSSYRPSSSGRPDELIVVTMLVATGCKANIPEKINSLADLKAALESLGGLPQDQVLGVELMWTPQVRGWGAVQFVGQSAVYAAPWLSLVLCLALPVCYCVRTEGWKQCVVMTHCTASCTTV